MKQLYTVAGVVALAALSACSSSSNNNNGGGEPEVPVEPVATLQVVHASSNAPAVNVTANGEVAFAEVDYKDAPLPATLDAGTTLDIGVDAIFPGGVTETVLEAPDQTFEGDTIYTVFAVGNVGDAGDTALQVLPITRSSTVVPSDTVRATVLHASAGAPAVDIFVTEPDAALDGVMPVNEMTPVEFTDFLGPVDIDAGEYQIRVTLPGDAEAVVFDSGPITLEGGSDPIIAAVDNTNAGAESPISLLVVDRLGVAEIQDIQTTAEIRVTHAVPDVGTSVEVLVDDEAAITNFNFTDSEGPLPLPAGDYVFQVAVNGTVVINGPTTDEDGNEVPPAATTLATGVYYDAIAVGSVTADNLGLLAEADDRRSVATAAKLRVIHASPSTEEVDLYIVDSETTDITAVEPFATDIPYLFNSGYLEVAPGTYNVYVTPAGTKDIAIPAEGITVEAGNIYTAIARDPVAPSSTLGLILLDDF